MATTHILPNAIIAAAEAGASGQPIFMLNLLRYNERAKYPDEWTLPPCSGREAYFDRYVPAFGALTEEPASNRSGSATSSPASSRLLTSSETMWPL